MKNDAPSHCVEDLSRIALQAAEELDKRITNPNGSKQNIVKLARALKTLFPGSGRPLLPSDTIGLVCDIIETMNNGGHRTKDYKAPMRIAGQIAQKLQTSRISREESVRMIRFCLALHGTARNGPSIHDIPEHHPYVLTFG